MDCLAKPASEYTGIRGFTCDLEGCQNRELTPVVCEKCNKNFCLSHRHAQDHRCKVLQAQKVETSNISKTAQHVNQILASKPAKPRKSRGSKSSKTAAKVALMKMKLAAVGESTPEEEKVFLQILLPSNCGTASEPMFFSKTWSIGRVIDSIADRLKLKNENNLLNSKKLRLFSAEDGDIFTTDSNLESLVNEESLFSGSSVILEYVDNNCLHLEDLKSYKPG